MKIFRNDKTVSKVRKGAKTFQICVKRATMLEELRITIEVLASRNYPEAVCNARTNPTRKNITNTSEACHARQRNRKWTGRLVWQTRIKAHHPANPRCDPSLPHSTSVYNRTTWWTQLQCPPSLRFYPNRSQSRWNTAAILLAQFGDLFQGTRIGKDIEGVFEKIN